MNTRKRDRLRISNRKEFLSWLDGHRQRAFGVLTAAGFSAELIENLLYEENLRSGEKVFSGANTAAFLITEQVEAAVALVKLADRIHSSVTGGRVSRYQLVLFGVRLQEQTEKLLAKRRRRDSQSAKAKKRTGARLPPRRVAQALVRAHHAWGQARVALPRPGESASFDDLGTLECLRSSGKFVVTTRDGRRSAQFTIETLQKYFREERGRLALTARGR